MNALGKNLAVEKTNHCHNVSIKEGCGKDIILSYNIKISLFTPFP